MSPARTGKPPKYRLHKARNLAKVTIRERDIYLGEYNSPESWKRYADVLQAWQDGLSVDAIKAIAKGQAPPVESENAAVAIRNTAEISVGQLSLKYFAFAEDYYASKDGSSNGRVSNVKSALRYTNDMFAGIPVAEFGPLKFLAVRDELVRRGLERNYINDLMSIVKLMFSWGVTQELVPATVTAPLREIRSLRKGKTEAPERKKVKPVPPADFEAVVPLLPAVVQNMVRLQLLTGARGSEIRAMKIGDVDRRVPEVWCYFLDEHKTDWHGKDRRIFIGPEAQKILLPYLQGAADQYCFTTGFEPNRPYSKDSYARVIKRACIRAKVTPWTPRQLRHSRATIIREQYGIEAAQVVLGHSDLRVTEVYAERNFEQAAQIMKEIG